MISCTEFIPAYSELFKFLHRLGGKRAVVEFWEHLSDTFLSNLRDLVKANGLRGCWMYWSHTLPEEAADFTMELDEEAGVFRVEMHRCPSKGRLLESDRVRAYPDYCEHCEVLYRRVLEPLGYSYEIDLSRADQAACSIVIRPAKVPPRGSGQSTGPR